MDALSLNIPPGERPKVPEADVVGQSLIELREAYDRLKAQYEAAFDLQSKTINHFQCLFDFSPVSYFVVSDDGKILKLNKCAVEFIGAESENLKEISLLNYISPEFHNTFLAHLEAVFSLPNAASSQNCEVEMTVENGKVHYVRLESNAFGGSDGETYCRSLLFDCTEQKRIEFELQKAQFELEKKIDERTSALEQERLRLAEAQQLAHIGNWEWDIRENRIIWSDELFRIIGMKPSEVKPTHGLFIEYVHPEDKEIALKSIEDAFNSDAVHVHSYRIVRTDNSVRTVEAITEIIKDARGNPVKMLGTARDITGKIEAAEKLKEVALIKLLNESAAAANMAETIEQAALTCIRKICEFSRWKIGQLYVVDGEMKLVSSGVRYIDETHQSQELNEFSRIYNFSTPTNLSQRVKNERKLIWTSDITKNDNPFTMLNAKKHGLRSGFAFPVMVKREVIGVLEFFSTDVIKEDPQLLQIVTYIGTHLGRVEERKRAQHELKIAKEKAESSEKVKEQFLANISHEIRTPLNGILGFTNLLAETDLNPQQRKYLSTVKHSTDNLLDIVNNVLDISKMETGKITFEEKSFDLHKLVKKAVSTIKPKAKSKHLDLNIVIDKQVPFAVKGDPLRLNQILLNLLSNAVKFTKKGKVEMTVQRMKEEKETVSLEFSVADTGIGIRQDKLNTIFESFTQASSDTTRKYGGTGLGLTIAKQLVELQNGTIKVKSQVNKGSVFSFQLSFKKTNNLPEKKKLHKTNTVAANQVTLKFARVLVVEDNAVNRQLVRRLIENRGLEVDTAVNGKAAVAKIEKNNYNLVLMDLQMPVMDGYEAARRIRALKDKKDIPIIAVTAHAMRGESEKCSRAGMNDYLSKPITAEELFAKIDKYIFNENLPEPAPAAKIETQSEINLKPLISMVKDNSKLLREMAELFIKNTPLVLRKIEKCVEENNFSGLKLYAHKLRSSVKIVGMEKCDVVLCSIEEDISAGIIDTDILAQKIESIKASCAQAIEELKKEVLSAQ